ncbi:MAG: ATP-dependent Clp protease adaptor ClpS [Saprospiraceae bacterium]
MQMKFTLVFPQKIVISHFEKAVIKLYIELIKMGALWEEKEEIQVADADTGTGKPAFLVVHNDDHNTFEWVIECFTTVLNHTFDQSEQLALIIHTKGRATVKTATLKTLRPLRIALVERGLSAVIEGGSEDEE